MRPTHPMDHPKEKSLRAFSWVRVPIAQSKNNNMLSGGGGGTRVHHSVQAIRRGNFFVDSYLTKKLRHSLINLPLAHEFL